MDDSIEETCNEHCRNSVRGKEKVEREHVVSVWWLPSFFPTFEDMKEIVGIVATLARATQKIELMSKIIDVVQRDLKELFNGKLMVAILKRNRGKHVLYVRV